MVMLNACMSACSVHAILLLCASLPAQCMQVICCVCKYVLLCLAGSLAHGHLVCMIDPFLCMAILCASLSVVLKPLELATALGLNVPGVLDFKFGYT